MSLEVVPAGELSLPELADVANTEHGLAMRSGIDMVAHAIRSGQALTDAKARMAHGEWGDWLKSNFEGDERTAQRYMLVAANTTRVSDMGEVSLRQALAAIADDGQIEMGGLKESVHVHWYTPARYVEAARSVMGGIDLDPASSLLANETIQAGQIFTEDDDGLVQDWHGRVWLNPPYGKGSGQFTSKLVSEYRDGNVESAVLLLNAYGFDSGWFQPLWEHLICFTNHRVVFTSPDHETGGPANANIFVYMGPDRGRFSTVFSEFGAVVERVG